VRGFAAIACIACGGCEILFRVDAIHAVDARSIDAPGVLDTMPTPCDMTSFVNRSVLTYTGNSFVRDQVGDVAVYFAISSPGSTIQMLTPDTVVLFDFATTGFDAPRFGPEGTDLWMRHAGTPTTFLHTVCNVATTSCALPLTMTVDATLAASDTPGTVTRAAFGPRHMMAAIGGALVELVEKPSAPETWATEHTYQPSELGVTTVADPSLTPDGLHLVFVAGTNAGPTVWVANRASLGSMFGPAMELYATTDMPTTPFLDEGCRHLTYTPALTTSPDYDQIVDVTH
jgi:hypothetical protein